MAFVVALMALPRLTASFLVPPYVRRVLMKLHCPRTMAVSISRAEISNMMTVSGVWLLATERIAVLTY